MLLVPVSAVVSPLDMRLVIIVWIVDYSISPVLMMRQPVEPNYIVAVVVKHGPHKGSTMYHDGSGLLVFNPLAALRMYECEAKELAGRYYGGFVLDWGL